MASPPLTRATPEIASPDSIPPGPELAAYLADNDRMCDLGDAELIDTMAAARRQTAWAQARELATIAELTTRRTAADQAAQPADHRVLSAGESLIEEIAAALTVTGNAAATLMHTADRLSHALPGTRTALEHGRIDLRKAQVICDATEDMPDHITTRMETALLAHASERTTGQLRRRAKTLARRLAPELSEELAQKTGRKRRVEVWDNATGTAALALLDIGAEDAHAIHNKITAAASAIKTDGDPRCLDQLRADLATRLLRGSPLPDAITALLTTPAAPGSGPAPDSPGTVREDVPDGTDDQDQERMAAAIVERLRERSVPDLRLVRQGPVLRRACHAITGPQPRPGPVATSAGIEIRPRRPGDRQRGDPPSRSPIGGIERAVPPTGSSVRLVNRQEAGPGSGTSEGGAMALLEASAGAEPRTSEDATADLQETSGSSVVNTLALDTQARLSALRSRLRATGRLVELPELAARTMRRLHHSLVPYRDTWCATNEHGRHGHPGYRPPTALRRAITERHPTCVFPTCNRQVQHCDLDHTIAYDDHGPTCSCNLAPLCRRHHRAKQSPGWSLFQPWPGLLIWITPAGTWHIVQPE